jgi:curved DNA-binding protein CbpA
MENRQNYYRLLHVQQDAPIEIIQSSYRALMLKMKQHPDLGGDNRNASLINEAYKVLTDPEKRARYDRGLAQFKGAKDDRRTEPRQPQEPRKGSGDARFQNFNSEFTSCCAFCGTPHSGDIRLNTDSRCFYCWSPLNPAAKMRLQTEQKRAVKRLARHGEITFYTCWPQQGHRGYIHDLSPLGMQMLTEEILHEGQIIKIESEILSATARVANRRRGNDGEIHGYAIGIKFLTLRFQRRLGTFVSVKA